MTRDENIQLLITMICIYTYMKYHSKINNFIIRNNELFEIGKEYYVDSKEIKSNIHYNNEYNVLIDDEDLFNIINSFFQTYSDEELITFKNNLSTLKIDEIDSPFIADSYDPINNIININKYFDINIIYHSLTHELHHMATNKGLINVTIISGFKQQKSIRE